MMMITISPALESYSLNSVSERDWRITGFVENMLPLTMQTQKERLILWPLCSGLAVSVTKVVKTMQLQ